MNIKEINVENIFKAPRTHNPSEIEDIIARVNKLHSFGKGLRIIEKNDKKREKLYWRIHSHIYHKKLPMKIKSEDKIIGVWSVA
jgi:hypothetical protein